MDERIRFLSLAYMTVFLALITIFAYRFMDLEKIENSIKSQYVNIYQNYSCTKTDALNEKGCVRNGYWYPECPKDRLNLSGGI